MASMEAQEVIEMEAEISDCKSDCKISVDDGDTSIDFILCFEEDKDEVEKKDRCVLCKNCCVLCNCCKDNTSQDGQRSEEDDEEKREKFRKKCEDSGLVWTEQNCQHSPTCYVQLQCPYETLLDTAEEILMCMALKERKDEKEDEEDGKSSHSKLYNFMHYCSCEKRDESNERVYPWYHNFERIIGVVLPEHLEREHLKKEEYFTAPFRGNKKEKFLRPQGPDKDQIFFTSAERSAIVYYILLKISIELKDEGKKTKMGLLDLLHDGTFTAAYPLHESSRKLDGGYQTHKKMTDRQFLYYKWSYWYNWYKRQPLSAIRRYFGEKIALYFTLLGFYTVFLIPASIVGIIVFLYSLSTLRNPISDEVCDNGLRYNFYMCPDCDGHCDFSYLRSSCIVAHFTRLFDNGATLFFAIFMAIWSVLFLEFWRRRQYLLQNDWDKVGFDETEIYPRPQFKKKTSKQGAHRSRGKNCESSKDYINGDPGSLRKDYKSIPGPISSDDNGKEKREDSFYIRYYSKITCSIVVSVTMVAVVVAILISIIIYKQAVSRSLKIAILDPSVGSITAFVTGAIIQFAFNKLMNYVYYKLAKILTNWENHRLQSEHDNSLIIKAYLFQFVNEYSSLFYLAFFRGNFAGNPGNYGHIGSLRLDICPEYGCLLELTIQLFIFMLLKTVTRNLWALIWPHVKRIRKGMKHREEERNTPWERDYDLIAVDELGLIPEYLDMVTQFGMLTLFAAALPLAPLFSLINNWFEIRLDAHKLISNYRRPVAQRARGIGMWYDVLSVVSKLAVVTNAFIIATTSQFIPIEVFTRGEYRENVMNGVSPLSGFVDWSLTNFTVEKLLDGNSFPAYDFQKLSLFDVDGTELTGNSTKDNAVLYLPFVNFTCLAENVPRIPLHGFTSTGLPPNMENSDLYWSLTKNDYNTFIVNNKTNRVLLINTMNGRTSPSRNEEGICFNKNAICRFRSFSEDGGFKGNRSVTIFGAKYWHVLTARFIFVVVFEHFVFVVAGLLGYLIPDVPVSVRKEMQKEKKHAYEVVLIRDEKQNSNSGNTTGEDVTA